MYTYRPCTYNGQLSSIFAVIKYLHVDPFIFLSLFVCRPISAMVHVTVRIISFQFKTILVEMNEEMNKKSYFQKDEGTN